MIWIYLGLLTVLMIAPFVLSWQYTGEKKRTVLNLPDDTSDVPFHNAIRHVTDLKEVIMLESLDEKAESVYEKPLFIKGSAYFGKNSILFTAHAKQLIISENCHVSSSLDAEEYLSVGKGCKLLGSAECDGDMDVAEGTCFYDLFARKIKFSEGAIAFNFDSDETRDLISSEKKDEIVRNLRHVSDQEIVEKTILTNRNLHVGMNAVIKGDIFAVTKIGLDDGVKIRGCVISKKTITIGKLCYIIGDVSTESDIEIKDNAVIFGNVISQSNIKIGPNCHVKGNVFAQNCIDIYENVIVGVENHIKSVIAGDTIHIRGNSTVYGRVRAIRGGIIAGE